VQYLSFLFLKLAMPLSELLHIHTSDRIKAEISVQSIMAVLGRIYFHSPVCLGMLNCGTGRQVVVNIISLVYK
jgi:hypothetical protein